MEVAGVGFQSRTSCALLPARLRALSRPSMGAFRAYAARGQRRGIPPRTTEYRRSHPYGRFRPGIPRTLRRSTFRVVCTARTVWFDSRQYKQNGCRSELISNRFSGGGGSRTRVLPRGRKASTGLGGRSSCRGAGGGPPRFRLRIPLGVPPVPRAWRGVSPGWVADRTRRSGRGTAGSVAIGAYAARARLPLLLAIESLPRVGDRRSTCDPRTRP